MNARVFRWLSIFVALVACMVAFRSWRETRHLAELTAGVAREKAPLAAALTNPPPPAPPAPVLPPAPTPATSPWSAEALKAMEEESRKSAKGYEQRLLSQPELQVLFEQRERGNVRHEHALLFRQLNLSPEQQNRFVDALVAWTMGAQDRAAMVTLKGMARDDPALKTLEQEANATVVREVEAVLGPEGTRLTREYSRLSAAHKYVASFAGLASRIGLPLTLAQIEQLAVALDVPGLSGPTLSKVPSVHWDSVSARAQTFLSPQQWQLFTTTTPPGQTGGKWASAAEELLNKYAPTATGRPLAP